LSTGNLIVASGQGIDFSATSGTGTSELFNDYEEGTWTGAISVNNFSGTTPTSLSGTYTKIGRTVQITLTLFAGGSSFDIGVLVRSDITGLPYSVGSVLAFLVAGSTAGVYGNARASGTTITMETISSSAAMYMQFTYQV
jgi:ABC-type transport system involved in multi-copper enzyme maturation permease subunit